MIVSFKFYVMNFIDFVIDCYTHITSHVTQVFVLVHTLHKLIFTKHCTCYCVSFGLTNQVWNYFEYCLCKTYFVFEFLMGEWLKILILGKLGFKTYVLEKHFISYSCIFISYLQCFEVCLQKSSYFSKKMFFQIFDWSNLFFDQSRFILKILWAFVCFNQSKLIFDQSKIINELF